MPKVIDIDHLFEVTVRMFADRGYIASTTSEVAKQAGINEATIFRRFGNKAKLLEAALIHCFSSVVPFSKVSESGELHADLIAIASAYQQTNIAYGGVVLALLNELPAHPELRSVFSVLQQNLKKSADIIESHQAQGNLGAGEPLQKVLFLLSPMMMTGLMKRAMGELVSVELDVDVVVDAFLDGHRNFALLDRS